MTYSLEECASLLHMHSATLLFWEEAFREELDVPRDPRGSLCFEERHLRAINEIRRMILDEKRSLDDVRQWLEEMRSESGAHRAESASVTLAQQTSNQSSGPLRETGNTPVSQVAEDIPIASSPAAPDVAASIEAFSCRVTELTETVGYLVEENRALQELIGRLIQYVEEIGLERREGHPRERQGGSNAAENHPESALPRVTPQVRSSSGSGTAQTENSSVSMHVDGIAGRSVRAGPAPDSPVASAGEIVDFAATVRSIIGQTKPTKHQPATAQSGRSRQVAATRPRLTLAERRAEIVAQREAARAQSRSEETSPPPLAVDASNDSNYEVIQAAAATSELADVQDFANGPTTNEKAHGLFHEPTIAPVRSMPSDNASHGTESSSESRTHSALENTTAERTPKPWRPRKLSATNNSADVEREAVTEIRADETEDEQ